MGAWVPRLHGGPASRRRRGNPDPPGAGGRPHRPAARRGGGVQAARRALMAKPRELRRRIKSVQSTRKITKTMELVATSKLKRAQDRVVAARPYAAALAEVIGDLYAPELAERFPLLRQPGGKSRRVALVVITANRGLCGAFNANLIREARRRIEQVEANGGTVDLHLIGKKGITYFKFAKRTVASQRIDVGDRPTAAQAGEIVGPLMAQFESGAGTALEVWFSRFK